MRSSRAAIVTARKLAASTVKGRETEMENSRTPSGGPARTPTKASRAWPIACAELMRSLPTIRTSAGLCAALYTAELLPWITATTQTCAT